jgi:hypothetical protein
LGTLKTIRFLVYDTAVSYVSIHGKKNFVFNVSLKYERLYARHVKVFGMREPQRSRGIELSEKKFKIN